MKLHDKFGYSKAIVVDEKMLTDINECIKEFFSDPKYSAELLDDSRIVFESLEELLSYENYGDKSIKYLKINFGYNKFEFEQTFSIFHSYKNSVSGEYVTKNVNESILFKKNIQNILEKGSRPWYYTFVTKFSVIYFLIVITVICIILTVILNLNGKYVKGDSNLSVSFLNIWICGSVIYFLIAHMFSKLKNKIFPVIAYKIGEQKKKIERRDDLISKFFWGVIVTGIVSVIISILF